MAVLMKREKKGVLGAPKSQLNNKIFISQLCGVCLTMHKVWLKLRMGSPLSEAWEVIECPREEDRTPHTSAVSARSGSYQIH